MKDTQLQPSPIPILLPKSKLGIKKAKMAAKKGKEHKTPIMKVGRGKKVTNVNRKAKSNKDNAEPTVKRKRGRPRNEDCLHIKKPMKEQKSVKKNERKTVNRKRKLTLNEDVKPDKELLCPPLKKSKINDNCNNINGDIKISNTPNHKPFVQKEEPIDELSTLNSNGALNCKKTFVFGQKKPPVSILKSATFHPPPRKELMNGNSNLTPFKMQPVKSKPFKKELGINFPKESEINFKFGKNNNITIPSKEPIINELSKFHTKDIQKFLPFKSQSKEPVKFMTKEPIKFMSKEPIKFNAKDTIKIQSKEPSKFLIKESLKSQIKECNKSQPKDSVKPQPKEPTKSQIKEPTKSQTKELIQSQTKEPTKSQTKEPTKSQTKEPAKSQTKEPTKSQTKSQTKEPTKSQTKEPTKSQAKESTKYQTKEPPKSQIKEPTKSQQKVASKSQAKEPLKPLPKEPVKSHPQRMASLDAMARMHVICTTDRKPPEHRHTSAGTNSSRPFSQKSVTQCHERIQFDIKKEADFEENIVQEINFVKEKQQVFVSHSVEQSAVVEHKQSKTIGTKVQHEKEKKKLKLPDKAINNKKLLKNKTKLNPSKPLKLMGNLKKLDKGKSKVSKTKEIKKKSAKVLNKAVSKISKTVAEKPEVKGICKKTKKIEQTKSEVKVKETIRMQKTCTYQSVTTVNSHGTSNSSVVPVSHVGMTTNYSKTKKTVVTDEECKNKVNYSTGSVINNTYCLTTESPCSVASHTDCCKFHAHPQIIPLAHVQTCSLGHSLNRTSDASPSSHCDGNCSVHRFGHQQPVIFSPPPPECGCCCPSSLVQNVHDSCLLRKSLVAYPHHVPSHHSHISTTAFSSETRCSDCHSGNTTLDSQRHHAQHYTISSPSTHSRVACACCELHRESNQHHHQSSLQYLSQPKTSSSLVPCEQTPLDLSLTSSTSNISIESDISLPQGHCSSPLCCSSRDLLLLRTSPHSFQHNKFSSNKPCCRCSKQILCETQAVDSVQSLCSNQSIIKIAQPPSVDRVSLLTSPVDQGSVPPVASTSSITNKSVPCVITDNSLVAAKTEKSVSPKQSSKPSVVPKKSTFAHGWSWKGKPRERLIALTNDSVPCARVCYPSVEHTEGDTVCERDCVLLRSGPKDTDLPYVAKVSAFWENPDDGEMMMSLLWYYRPEHTDQGRKPGQMEDEVFASRHKDVNSVACIEDKCYVLTYNEYCRYKASLSMDDDMVSLSSMMVPGLIEGYARKGRLPCEPVSQDIVFFCRHVYDFRQKRILKNPT